MRRRFARMPCASGCPVMLAWFLCGSLICRSRISMTVQFRLLGDIEMRVSDQVIDLGHARRRHVLGVLLNDANQVIPVGQLVERVWGDQLPVNPAGALQSYISLLRRAPGIAGNVIIARQAPGY